MHFDAKWCINGLPAWAALQARDALQALIELVEDHPTFVRPYVVAVAGAMLRIVAHADFDAETRKLALEFLLQVRRTRAL